MTAASAARPRGDASTKERKMERAQEMLEEGQRPRVLGGDPPRQQPAPTSSILPTRSTRPPLCLQTRVLVPRRPERSMMLESRA